MTIDFHYHTILTKRVPFDYEYLETTARWARRHGLDAIAMTDHFNSFEYESIHPRMRGRYQRTGDAYIVGELLVFPGMEVDVAEGPHILLVNESERIDELAARLASHKTEGAFMPAERLLPLAREMDSIIVCAHPLRLGREIQRIRRELWGYFDAIGLNGKDRHIDGESVEERTWSLGTGAEIPVVGGSDTHHYLQAGAIRNYLEAPATTIHELRRAITSGGYRVEVDRCVDVRVEAAMVVKRTLKEYVLEAPGTSSIGDHVRLDSV